MTTAGVSQKSSSSTSCAGDSSADGSEVVASPVAQTQIDLPGDGGGEGSFSMPPAAGVAPASPSDLGSAEVGKMVEEFERRIAHLEGRLEEVLDSKERVERQVAAQTEELRVQRAAIARTQRVLRGIARPEDEASEPAPKV